jgi:hypothetical protein
MFGGHRGDRGDLHSIANMMSRLNLTWSEDKLADLRSQARWLVQRQRGRIRTVAAALIEHRRLTLTDLRWLRACTPPSRPVCATV